MAEPCNASSNYRGGVGCELDHGHSGCHRHGGQNGEAVYWFEGVAYEVMTMLEVMQQAVILASFVSDSNANPVGSITVASLAERIGDADALARMEYKAMQALETLLGARALSNAAAIARREAPERRRASRRNPARIDAEFGLPETTPPKPQPRRTPGPSRFKPTFGPPRPSKKRVKR